MFDRPELGEQAEAVLVHVGFPHIIPQEMSEFRILAASAGLAEAVMIQTSKHTPDAKYFVGSGKLAEIKSAIESHAAQLAVINYSLTPSQERNIERFLQCRVLDRTGLILEIFAARARTFEGKLQVELAQLKYMSTRLVRGWTHLERQRGGGVSMRGQGETQLEVDRRLVNDRMSRVKKKLEKVRKQRVQNRRSRDRSALPVIALVGYTNAGKSTLFNTLTGEDVYAENKLFATLDPTLRRTTLPQGLTAIMADTVGFIQHLPHDLIEAFRATLEETRLAHLLIHVIDVNDTERRTHIQSVNDVLAEIGAKDLPQIEVFNKIDLTDASPRVEYDQIGFPKRVYVSAKTGEGLSLLLQAIVDALAKERVHCCIKLHSHEGKKLADLRRLKAIVHEFTNEQGVLFLEVDLPLSEMRQWLNG